MRTAPAALAALALTLLPATAAAQDPVGTTGATGATGTTTAPAPAGPATGKLALAAEKVGRGKTVLSGARWRVRGTLTPYVAGQKAVVRFTRGGKGLKTRTVTLQASKTGGSGSFLVSFRGKGAGRVSVTASHAATAELATVRSRTASVDVLPSFVGSRSSKGSVRILQQRLARFGYVVGRRGSFDGRTQRAVVAYRKNMGMARNARADRAVFSRLAKGQGAFEVKYPNHGRHVEGDISKQVVALIGAGGKVERIYPTSSGKDSTPTILGSFKIYRKDYGTNQLGMVDASYFIRGYAIHGYSSVPTYNASHGCLRVPVPDARTISNWVRYGTRVDTYR